MTVPPNPLNNTSHFSPTDTSNLTVWDPSASAAD